MTLMSPFKRNFILDSNERHIHDNWNVASSDKVVSLESLLAYSRLYGPSTLHCIALQRKLTKLLDKFRYIFALTVSTTPAVVDEPMKIIINKKTMGKKFKSTTSENANST